jgi:aldose 1-epimerase
MLRRNAPAAAKSAHNIASLRTIMAFGLASALLFASNAFAAQAHRENFGQLNGVSVGAVVLTNAQGIRARIIAYGAALQELDVPGRDGKLADVVLSYPDMNGFIQKPQYFGATIGRYGNRIGGATFDLDGHSYKLSANDGVNTLHGGQRGFDKVLWTISSVQSGPQASVTFTHASPDGDQGYPGTLQANVTYALDDHNALTIRYEATTDKPTIVNLTNHSLFNMAGAESGRDVLGQRLTIAARAYTPVDKGLIPTGALRPVAGSPFDFREPHLIGERIRDGSEPQLVIGHGYDHNFVIDGGVTADPKFQARLEDPVSGRTMEILSTEPGLQVYSGNFLDGTVVGKKNQIYRQGDGIALEPQHYPDSPHHSNFPSTRLDPGKVYRSVSIYRFSVSGH